MKSNAICTGNAGNIAITNITGDIAITTGISAWNASLARRGTLIMQAGGRITLASLGLDRFQYAAFDPGMVVDVVGPIIGTDGELLAGNGTALSNATSELRLAPGKRLIYRPTENPGLLDAKYVLPDLTGAAGAGGILQPWSPAGTVVVFQ